MDLLAALLDVILSGLDVRLILLSQLIDLLVKLFSDIIDSALLALLKPLQIILVLADLILKEAYLVLERLLKLLKLELLLHCSFFMLLKQFCLVRLKKLSLGLLLLKLRLVLVDLLI